LEGLARACGFKQNISQPRCIATLQFEGLAEYPSLVPAAWVGRAQAIVLDLADIEDSLIAVWQTRRHICKRTSCLASLSECMNGSYSDALATSTTDLSDGSLRCISCTAGSQVM
jgi:hypothetical protein